MTPSEEEHTQRLTKLVASNFRVSSDSNVLRRLRDDAATHLDGGNKPISAARAARDTIPPGHPLYQLIVAQSGR